MASSSSACEERNLISCKMAGRKAGHFACRPFWGGFGRTGRCALRAAERFGRACHSLDGRKGQSSGPKSRPHPNRQKRSSFATQSATCGHAQVTDQPLLTRCRHQSLARISMQLTARSLRVALHPRSSQRPHKRTGHKSFERHDLGHHDSWNISRTMRLMSSSNGSAG